MQQFNNKIKAFAYKWNDSLSRQKLIWISASFAPFSRLNYLQFVYFLYRSMKKLQGGKRFSSKFDENNHFDDLNVLKASLHHWNKYVELAMKWFYAQLNSIFFVISHNFPANFL